jgi:hypothetical protein
MRARTKVHRCHLIDFAIVSDKSQELEQEAHYVQIALRHSSNELLIQLYSS